MEGLAREIGRLSLYTECREDDVVKNGNWHTMQNLSAFTVCGECFDEVVQRIPLVDYAERWCFRERALSDRANCMTSGALARLRKAWTQPGMGHDQR